TYQPVLDAHGWGDVCGRLSRKAAAGEWASMAKEISDEMLDAFSLSGSPEEIPGKIKQRYAGLLDRVSSYFPPVHGKDDERWRKIVRAFRAA
ncbi:MAG: LLM class flavin-dependent oxidoreductase, partial [Candidatus Binatia bacterium]